jgi:hypothetical protein
MPWSIRRTLATAAAGSIDDMFKFGQPSDSTLLLNPKTGEVLH